VAVWSSAGAALGARNERQQDAIQADNGDLEFSTALFVDKNKKSLTLDCLA
jgi:hypothetical protein